MGYFELGSKLDMINEKLEKLEKLDEISEQLKELNPPFWSFRYWSSSVIFLLGVIVGWFLQKGLDAMWNLGVQRRRAFRMLPVTPPTSPRQRTGQRLATSSSNTSPPGSPLRMRKITERSFVESPV